MNNDHKDMMYLALKENMINSLESNEFYDLFNSSIKAGTNNLSLYQRYMDNVIDPKWVQAIENAIIPLDNIIRNPRRFIKQEEEVVPIEQAKKISQESIRHLAQHTNMIQTVDKDGSVTPNKILNILKEETFATYENRFIYTLLKHIQYFIDKRLKLLTDSKVLTENKVSVQSEFNLGNEKIKYEFALSSTEKTEKNRKMFKIDEDTSQMDLHQRIERLRMILYDFQNSQLIKNLNGCALVKPPIMRTNVILKDPNFKKAMELWTYIESYTDAGLTVQVVENQEIPSNEYIEEIFKVSLLNYYIFNHHVKPQKQLENFKPVKKEFKPNLVKRTVEEYVDEFSIDIDEVEKIFIDQIKRVTQKRKEEYAKIRKAIDRALNREKVLKKKYLEAQRRELEKQKLLAIRAAKKALEEERKALKLKIQNRVNVIIDILQKTDNNVVIKTDKYKKNLNVFKSDINIISCKSSNTEYRLSFRYGKKSFDNFTLKHPNVISKLENENLKDQYQIIDNANIGMRDIKTVLVNALKYSNFLVDKAKKDAVKEEKARLANKKKMLPELIKLSVDDFKNYLLRTYNDVYVVETKQNYKVFRNRKLVCILQKTNSDYRITFQIKQDSVHKLIEKYPAQVKKVDVPKGNQWYKITDKCTISKKEIYTLLNNSYKYVVEEERKLAIAREKEAKAKEKELAKAKALKEKELEKKAKFKEIDLKFIISEDHSDVQTKNFKKNNKQPMVKRITNDK